MLLHEVSNKDYCCNQVIHYLNRCFHIIKNLQLFSGSCHQLNDCSKHNYISAACNASFHTSDTDEPKSSKMSTVALPSFPLIVTTLLSMDAIVTSLSTVWSTRAKGTPVAFYWRPIVFSLLTTISSHVLHSAKRKAFCVSFSLVQRVKTILNEDT